MNKQAARLYSIVSDWLAALIAWFLFYLVRVQIEGFHPDYNFFSLLYGGIPLATFWLLVYTFWGFYYDIFRKSRIRELFSIFNACLIGIAFIYLLLILDVDGTQNYKRYYRTVAIYFGIHAVVTGLAKTIVLTYIKKLILKKVISFNTIIVGSSHNAKEIYHEIDQNNPHLGLNFLGYVYVTDEHHDEEGMGQQGLPNLGDYHNLEQTIENNRVEQVIIAIESSEHKTIEDLLNTVEGTKAKVAIIPDIYQILLGAVRVNHLYGIPLIEVKQNLMPYWQMVTKRTMDIVVSLLVLTLGFPFLFAVGLITWLTSKGPVLYRQERIGQFGVPFNILKFRSMRIDAEQMGPQLSSSHDPRITNWGRFMRKTRLDEFPQFYNVLVGDMSLVGPRPERQYFIDKIVAAAPHYKHLNRVRPGITSLGQVKYGYAENVDQMVRRLKYDILYIENMSLAMDFRILLYTVITMLGGKGK